MTTVVVSAFGDSTKSGHSRPKGSQRKERGQRVVLRLENILEVKPWGLNTDLPCAYRHICLLLPLYTACGRPLRTKWFAGGSNMGYALRQLLSCSRKRWTGSGIELSSCAAAGVVHIVDSRLQLCTWPAAHPVLLATHAASESRDLYQSGFQKQRNLIHLLLLHVQLLLQFFFFIFALCQFLQRESRPAV